MATTSQLENQIRELRSQLAESDRKLRNLRAEIDENNTRQYEELRCKYNKLLEKKTKENSIKYEQELQCLRMEMFELNKQSEKAVHQAIQTARRDLRELLEIRDGLLGHGLERLTGPSPRCRGSWQGDLSRSQRGIPLREDPLQASPGTPSRWRSGAACNRLHG